MAKISVWDASLNSRPAAFRTDSVTHMTVLDVVSARSNAMPLEDVARLRLQKSYSCRETEAGAGGAEAEAEGEGEAGAEAEARVGRG